MDRLFKIAECIQSVETVADIGCDHGFLEKILVKENRAKKVIATDISSKSLQKSVLLCKKLGIEKNIDFRVGNGLSVIASGEADMIVIAGMGGILIAEILKSGESAAQNAKKLVLCPHSHVKELRKFLIGNGYRITQEKLSLEEGRYYQIICAVFCNETTNIETDDFYFEIGTKLLESGDEKLKGFLEYKLAKIEKIIEKASCSNREDTALLILTLSRYADKIREVMKCQ